MTRKLRRFGLLAVSGPVLALAALGLFAHQSPATAAATVGHTALITWDKATGSGLPGPLLITWD